jgi:hypothetical protein
MLPNNATYSYSGLQVAASSSSGSTCVDMLPVTASDKRSYLISSGACSDCTAQRDADRCKQTHSIVSIMLLTMLRVSPIAIKLLFSAELPGTILSTMTPPVPATLSSFSSKPRPNGRWSVTLIDSGSSSTAHTSTFSCCFKSCERRCRSCCQCS